MLESERNELNLRALQADVPDPFEGYQDGPIPADPDEGINPLYIPKRRVMIMLEIPADGKPLIDVIGGISPEYQKFISSVNVRDRSFD